MRIWKYLGWDTKESRTERNLTNNNHATLKWGFGCIAIIVVVYIINK